MITTTGEAKQRRCPMDIGKGNGNCQTTNCLAWEYWVDPKELTREGKPHGIKRDSNKLGYCGLSKRR